MDTPPDQLSTFLSGEVGRAVWPLEEQRRSLLADVRDATPEELAWQPAPGMNTIGMLLVHLALTEAYLGQIGFEGRPQADTRAAIGLAEDADGMPMPEGGRPPRALEGEPLGFFAALLERAREGTLRATRELSAADLYREVTWEWPGAGRRTFNLRWLLSHLLQHEAHVHGQVNLLRHLYRERGRVPGAVDAPGSERGPQPARASRSDRGRDRARGSGSRGAHRRSHKAARRRRA